MSTANPISHSFGIVETQTFTFAADEPFVLESGGTSSPVTVATETYGALNADRSNALLICHALSGNAHAAGLDAQGQEGWWDNCIGPGRAFNGSLLRELQYCARRLLRHHRPSEHQSGDGQTVRAALPVVTIGDMCALQLRPLDHLGIDKLLCAVGGSMGGMQALEWPARHPIASGRRSRWRRPRPAARC